MDVLKNQVFSSFASSSRETSPLQILGPNFWNAQRKEKRNGKHLTSAPVLVLEISNACRKSLFRFLLCYQKYFGIQDGIIM